MKRDYIDFFIVKDEHQAIHQRLEDWARWVKPQNAKWFTQPMFRQYRSHAWQWHRPEPKRTIDTLDADKIERAVRNLPNNEMWAIRWAYVFRSNPANYAAALGVDGSGLMRLIHQAREALKNA